MWVSVKAENKGREGVYKHNGRPECKHLLKKRPSWGYNKNLTFIILCVLTAVKSKGIKY